MRAHSPHRQASWSLLCYSCSSEVPQQCVMHAVSLPLISHCFETRWQMRSLSFSSSPLQGLPNQYTAPLPASDVQRDSSSAAVEQNKTYPVTRQSCISIPRLFSANSSYVNGYFLFTEAAHTSHRFRGTLLQSTCSGVFEGKHAGGRSWQGTALSAAPACWPLGKLEIQNMFSFDWRSAILFA